MTGRANATRRADVQRDHAARLVPYLRALAKPWLFPDTVAHLATDLQARGGVEAPAVPEGA